jgi:hypothetical protein
MKQFLDHLVSEKKMESYRITRCKMGFRSIENLPEWHIMMEFNGMAQMDEAFKRVAPLEGDLETSTRVSINLSAAIYNMHFLEIGQIHYDVFSLSTLGPVKSNGSRYIVSSRTI